jgi:hypothetical protein
VVFVFMGLSFRILDGVHEPILAITALTIIIYDMYENMERGFGVRCGEIRAFHPPERARMPSACAVPIMPEIL